MPTWSDLKSNFCMCYIEKKDLSPTEEWGVDQQLISKLKEQYKKERKGKKGVQSEWSVWSLCLSIFLSLFNLSSFCPLPHWPLFSSSLPSFFFFFLFHLLFIYYSLKCCHKWSICLIPNHMFIEISIHFMQILIIAKLLLLLIINY